MKRILISLTLIISLFSAKAQDAKPTKEQTIEYIQNNYPKGFYVGTTYNFKDPGYEPYFQSFSGNYSIRLDINKDSVLVQYTDSLHEVMIAKALGRVEGLSHKYGYTVKFALKDIEAMGGTYANYVGNYKNTVEQVSTGCFPFFINFFAAGGKKLITRTYNGKSEEIASVSIPYTSVCKNQNSSFAVLEVTQTQIYKAFNHLRKLCGAPEPIKFE